MRALSTLALALTLACTGASAWAQTSTLESRMGSAQFRTSGLHKLDPVELRALEQWLASQMTAAPATEAQLAEARAAGREEAAASQTASKVAPEPVTSTLVGRFEGFRRGREYTLANGQVWRQVNEASLDGGRAESPVVEIEPARLGGWWMRVAGYNLRSRVERVR
ncbi:conserved exported hypothetical protein [Luteimonas sp. 9C]|uniref:hypothetical protein n=1 Tax=Luteimonas sp. 9C TaxID=2653148 RepID=UPI0012EEE6F5|nr:hypothetical protein [Luteimonas sp. 9C]VXB95232.1 conserved exported hypothetical protein [Luteimonas sp. 9C]